MEVRNLSYSVGHRRLFSNISFNTAESPLILIQGKNGTGKSTLLKVILGLLKPEEGQVINHQKVGYVPDSSENYFVGMTPTLLFHFLEKQFSLDSASTQELLSDLQAKFSFKSEFLHHKIQDLSLGERKKVMIMAAWMLSPQLVVMDEPFSGLDASSLSQLRDLIETGLAAGRHFIIVTHDHHELVNWSRQIIRL